ncbi:MAG: putative surface layer protein, partial [Evtepia sp.]|nr:putative surface layer protein [Evtepia sp.]
INGWNKMITGRTTSQMSGAGSGVLPTSWSTDVWQTSADTYPQLKVFASSSDTATALYSWLSAVPIYLYENTTSSSLSDTNKLVRHSFNLPSISGATWSSSNSSVLSVSGNTVSFSAPASDTEVTLTLTKDSLTKDFTLMCKSGVNPSDTAAPQITMGTVAPGDFSTTIPATVDETSNVYVVTLPKSAAAPTVDEILSSNAAVHLSGSGTLSATVTGLSCLTEYTAYACAVDSMGNVSSIVKADFTTLQDQTPPSSVGTSYFSTDTDTHVLSFGACFNEVGSIKYVVVPSSTSVPTSTQVSQGKDASGGVASYYGSFNYAYANASSTLHIDIANYAQGSYSLYFVCVDAVGNVSAVVSEPNASTNQNSFIIPDTTAPSGYSASFDETYINSGNQAAASFTVSGAENQATYNYTISSSGGAATVTGSGTISSANQQITGIDLSSLSDGTLTLSVKLTDTSGNTGSTNTDTVKKDTFAPSISLSSPIGTGVSASTAAIELSFSETVTGITNGTVTLSDGVNTYTYTIGASDSYISGTDTSCKATIPLSRFLDSTNKPLSLAHGKTYTAAISSDAYKDGFDNLISANANIGSFTVSSDTRSSAKAINAFSIGSYAGTIDQTNHTISVTVPYATSVSALTPMITVSEKATVSPVSGAMQNFTTPVTYTVTAENGTTQSYTVTVTVASSNTGGSSSSGSASSSSGDNTTKEITIPVSSNDGSSKVVVTTKDGKATISMNDSQLAAIASAAKDIGTVTADVSGLKVDEATVPSKMVSAVQSAKGFRGLAVALPTGTVTLAKDALASVGDKGDVTFSVKTISSSKLTDTQKAILGAQADSAVVVDVNVFVGGTKTSTFGGGKITVSIPYALKSGENSGSITVWFMKDDGTIEPKKGTYADGKVTFTTEHLSQYLIVSFPFADVAEDSWYYGSVAYAYNNGLFSGTSDKTFSPDAAMTRQMIWMVLARMDGKVPTNMDDARAWAVENGISDGTNPTSSITREQMAKILYRYAQYKGYKTTQGGMAIRKFADYDSISEYALLPLAWAVNAGLVQGSDNNLMPQGGASRAQVATILLRFYENEAK